MKGCNLNNLCCFLECTCKDLLNSYGNGNCKPDPSDDGKKWCYVTQSSSCSDLGTSSTMPGENWSYEACGMYISNKINKS